MKIANPADSEKIAAAIRSSQYSQREVAKGIDVSDVTISNYVSGWRKPSPGNLSALARFLGVPVRELMNDNAA